MRMGAIKEVCAIFISGFLAGSAFAADWTYVPGDYTDANGKIWDTISDGNWRLCVTASGINLTTRGEGTPSSVPPFAVEGSGILDLSKPIRSADGSATYRLTAIRQSAFWKFAKAFHADTQRGITSFIAPKELETQAHVVFCDASDLVSATYDSPRLSYIDRRAFERATALENVDLKIPAAKWLGHQFLSGMTSVSNCVSDWRFDSLEELRPRVFGSLEKATGNFYFPSATRVAHQAFLKNTKIRGLLFGSENPAGQGLVHIGKDTTGMSEADALAEQANQIDKAYGTSPDVNKISVAYGASLDFLVIGKGENQSIEDYAFSGITSISNIFFCGDKPSFGDTVFRHLTEKSAVFYVPEGNETWAEAVSSATAPSAEDIAEFEANHAPGTLIGVINSQTHLGGNSNRRQYIAYGNYRQHLNDVVTTGHPDWAAAESDAEFFWECERTIRDLPVGEETAVMAPGPIVKDGIRYSVTGFTQETATQSGWSDPVESAGDVYLRPAGTRGTVRITWKWEITGGACTASASAADTDWTGDVVVLTLQDGTPIPDIIGYGTILKATPSHALHEDFPKVRFAGWEGLEEGDTVAADGSVTFAWTGTERRLKARFFHDWVYDANAGTVWNRRYRLRVSELEPGKLGIGNAESMNGKTAAYGNAFILEDESGNPIAEPESDGALDLRGVVTDSTGGQSYRFTAIGYRALSPWSTIADDARVAQYYPTEIATPGTLTKLGGYVFGSPAWDYYPMKRLDIFEPELSSIEPGVAPGHRNLFQLVLDCPKLKTIPKDVVNSSRDCLKETDLSEWNLPLVETVATQAFGNNCVYPNITGTLDLPSLRELGVQALSPLAGAETFVLGTNGFSLASIDKDAFLKCSALKRIVVGSKGTIVVNGTIAPESASFNEIDFPGRMPVNLREFLDAMLATKSVANGAADYVNVTGSRRCGLDGRIPWDSVFTEDEILHKPETAGTFGIYATAEGTRKAYLTDRPCGWDPKGMCVIVR